MTRTTIMFLLVCAFSACGGGKPETLSWLSGKWQGHYREQKGMYAGQEGLVQLDLKEDGSFTAVLGERYGGKENIISFNGRWTHELAGTEGPILVLNGTISRWLRGPIGAPEEFTKIPKSEIVWRARAIDSSKKLRAEDWTFPPDETADAIKINPLLRLEKQPDT